MRNGFAVLLRVYVLMMQTLLSFIFRGENEEKMINGDWERTKHRFCNTTIHTQKYICSSAFLSFSKVELAKNKRSKNTESKIIIMEDQKCRIISIGNQLACSVRMWNE